MNKEFEKILKKTKEKCKQSYITNHGKDYTEFDICTELSLCFNEVQRIVQEVVEEYNGGWIPCSERLPEKNGMYLCTQNSYDLATNKNIIRVSTELVEFYDGKWRRAKNLVITHWQPLPEPFQPKGV